ncbi:DUF1700 domain-containing protein [bacterium]|nr:DUF1700 domain-containing protein [bacterium]
MKKQDFINQLKTELQGLPESEISDIIRDQEEMISDAIAAGRTEEQIVISFGDPKELARSLKAEIKIDKATGEKNLPQQVKGAFGALGALLVLAPFNLIFVLGPFCAVLGTLVAGWSVTVAMGVVSLVLMGAFFVKFIFVSAGLAAHLSTFFGFLGFIGLSVLFGFAMYYVTKFVFKMVLSYFKWNLNFIKSQA